MGPISDRDCRDMSVSGPSLMHRPGFMLRPATALSQPVGNLESGLDDKPSEEFIEYAGIQSSTERPHSILDSGSVRIDVFHRAYICIYC